VEVELVVVVELELDEVPDVVVVELELDEVPLFALLLRAATATDLANRSREETSG